MSPASPELRKRIAVLMVSVPVLLGVTLFVPAGTLRYWQAWAFLAVLLVPMSSFVLYYLGRDPQLLERRLRTKETERPQRIVLALAYPAFLAAYLIPGFDRRFGWSSVPPALSVAADIVVLAGYGLFVLVMRENSYASRVIEVDERQRVISTGPYAIVRHPMYVANILIYLAGPLALGSFWALIPALVTPALMVIRILNEEKVLKAKLPGYETYLDRVKYRLVPGLW